MNRSIADTIKDIFIIILWALALFAQHIICFDLFETDFLYLYMLATLCALLQYTALLIERKRQSTGRILKIFGIAYVCIVVWEVLTQVYFFRFQPQLRGLDVLCLVIDISGVLFTRQHTTK